ncbi:MAG TPA: ABC transporter permease subunit [Lachnospiraceae bacterium]|nr:ABC transporter permease subunit [Lachnospiraceae bacterium]
MTILKLECKLNFKTMLIWALSMGLTCFLCLILYESLQETMEDMAESVASMGAVAVAMGMDRVNLGTVDGYYAIEIATILSLGGAMYAAMAGAGMVAKEEEGHTSEFINTLPQGRIKTIAAKYAAMVVMIIAFQTICIAFILLGFACMGVLPDIAYFCTYHICCLFLQLEIGSICFLLSAAMRKRPIGAGLGIALLLYVVDLMCRIIPAIKNLKYITPFYFSNASDIFSDKGLDVWMVLICILITVLSFIFAQVIYKKRDLMA